MEQLAESNRKLLLWIWRGFALMFIWFELTFLLNIRGGLPAEPTAQGGVALQGILGLGLLWIGLKIRSSAKRSGRRAEKETIAE